MASLSRVPVIVVAGNSAERFACARFIHNMSVLKPQPFVAVTCDPRAEDDRSWDGVATARGSAGLRGWLARARGGTLFIDHVEQMSAELQQQLSDTLDHSLGSVDNPLADVRLISGAGPAWAGACEGRRFSERLYYRLNIMRVEYSRPRQVGSTSPYREFLAQHVHAAVGVTGQGRVPPVHA